MADCIGLYFPIYLLVVSLEKSDSSNLGDLDCPIVIVYHTSDRYPETIPYTFLLEFREAAATLAKEVGIGGIKISDCLLQGLAWGVLQEC